MGAGGGKGPGTKTLAQMREEAPLLGAKTVPEMAA
jgi:hypothetical protein